MSSNAKHDVHCIWYDVLFANVEIDFATQKPYVRGGQCVVGCSDGIWENIDHKEATLLILDAGPKNPSAGVDALMEV
eukprot:1949258-Amphidinium_carterae.1